MKERQAPSTEFKKHFSYTDQQIRKLGNVVIGIIKATGEKKKDVRQDIYLYYIKRKWTNYFDKHGVPMPQNELFNLKYTEWCVYYRELLPHVVNEKISASLRNRKRA